MAGALAERTVGFSTGGTGRQERSFNRTYHNWEGLPMRDAGVFIATFNNGAAENAGPRQRHVLRTLTTQGVANALVTDRAMELQGAVEYAVPIKTSAGELYLVGAAQNGPERNGPGTQLQTVADLPQGPVRYTNEPRGLQELVERSHGKGARFVSTLNSDIVFDDVSTLFTETYGWTPDGLGELRERLRREADLDPSERTGFFVGSVDNEGLLAASMAEPLQFALPGDNVFTLWESTEWVANPHRKVNGHSAATVMLNQGQIAAAHGEKGNITIIAETNQSTPAGGVARSVGMRIPRIEFTYYGTSGDTYSAAPRQVLKDNVGVNDRKPAEGPLMTEGGRDYALRSFDLYQTPHRLIIDLSQPNHTQTTRAALARA